MVAVPALNPALGGLGGVLNVTEQLSGEGNDRSLKDVLDAVERQMIESTLTRCGGNKSEAARQLGISRSNLIAKAQAFGGE